MRPTSPHLLKTLTSFTRLLTGELDTADLLHRLCDAAVDGVTVTGAGILVEDVDGSLRYAVASDEMSGEMEELQLTTGDGPCMLVHATGERVLIDDLTAEARFPAFTPGALSAGVRAIFTFPMHGRDRAIGVLDLYRRTPGALRDEEADHAQVVADLAAAAVLNRRVHDDAAAQAARLQKALDARIAMEQAKGRVSEQTGTDPRVAETMIYRYARRHGASVGSVVRAITEGSLRMGDET